MLKRISPNIMFYICLGVSYMLILFSIKLQTPAVFLLWLGSAIAILMRLRFHQYTKFLYVDTLILFGIIYLDSSLALMILPTLMLFIFKQVYLIFAIPMIVIMGFYLKTPIEYAIFFYSMVIALILQMFKTSYDDQLKKLDQLHYQAHLKENETKKMIASLDELSRISVLSERDRIAHKLHDNIGHELTGGLLALRAFEMSQDQPIDDESFKTLKHKLENAIESLKETVSYTQPQESYGFERIKELIFSHQHPKIDLKTAGNMLKLSETHYFMMLSVIKEGLTNILKHAEAHFIEIKIEVLEPVLRLMIKNDGLKPKQSSSGYGLNYMRKTIEAVGGTLTYHKHDTFTLICVLPIIFERSKP